jgi:hypothetical protein
MGSTYLAFIRLHLINYCAYNDRQQWVYSIVSNNSWLGLN